MANISILGLGAMGRRMAERLLQAGHAVTVWNRSTGRSEGLDRKGARIATTPREAVKGAQFVVAMVRDDDASRAIWFDPSEGATVELAPDTVVIESSTLSPSYVGYWATKLRAAGAIAVEAPVSGSTPQAEAGKLVYFLGGEVQDVQAVLPILQSLGQTFHHVGPMSRGAVVKLATNTILAFQIGAWSEVLAVLLDQDVDVSAALSAVATTSA